MIRRRATDTVAVMTAGACSRRDRAVVERCRYPSGCPVATVARRRRHHVIGPFPRGDRAVVAAGTCARSNAAVVESRSSPDRGSVAGVARFRRHDVGQRLASCFRSVVARRAGTREHATVIEQRSGKTYGAVADAAWLRDRRVRSRHRYRVETAAGSVTDLARLGSALQDAAHMTVRTARRFVRAGQRKSRRKMLRECRRSAAGRLCSGLPNPDGQRDRHEDCGSHSAGNTIPICATSCDAGAQSHERGSALPPANLDHVRTELFRPSDLISRHVRVSWQRSHCNPNCPPWASSVR